MDISSLLVDLVESPNPSSLPSSPITSQLPQNKPHHLQLPEPPQNGWAAESYRSTPSNTRPSTTTTFPLFSNTDPNTIFFSDTPTSSKSSAKAAARIIGLATAPPLSPPRKGLHPTSAAVTASTPVSNAATGTGTGPGTALTSGVFNAPEDSPQYNEWEEEDGGEETAVCDSSSSSSSIPVFRHRSQELPRLIKQVQWVITNQNGRITAAKLGSKLAALDATALHQIKNLCGGLLPLLEMYPNLFYLLHAPPLIYVCTKEQWEIENAVRKSIRTKAKENGTAAVAVEDVQDAYNKDSLLLESMQKKMPLPKFIHWVRQQCVNILIKEQVTQRDESSGEGVELVHLCNVLRRTNGVHLFRRVKSQCGGMKKMLSAKGKHANEGAAAEGGYGMDVVTNSAGKTFVVLQASRNNGGGSNAKKSFTCCLHLASVPLHYDAIKLKKEFTLLKQTNTMGSTEVQGEEGLQGGVDDSKQLKDDYFCPVVKLVRNTDTKEIRYAFVSYATPAATEYVYETMKRNSYWNDKVSYSTKSFSASNPSNSERGNTTGGTKKIVTKKKKKKRKKKVLDEQQQHATLPFSSNPGNSSQRSFAPSRHLWIGRCVATSKNHLNQVFGFFGEIESISYDKRDHFAFIDFVEPASAMRAFIAMQHQTVGAKKVVLAFGRQDGEKFECHVCMKFECLCRNV